MASRKARERMLAEVRGRIEQYGWAVQAIGNHCVTHGCTHQHGDEAEFAYTVGLSRFHGHPELILFGLPQHVAGHLLNHLGERVRGGEMLRAGIRLSGVADGYDVHVIAVEDSSRHLTLANALYRNPGKPPIRALQVVFPDRDGRFPWDDGYSMHPETQPLLGPFVGGSV